MGLRELNLEPSYRGVGIGTQVFLPCAQKAVSLDAISAFFSVGGLKMIAPGLDAIRQKQGSVRVVMSLQDADGSDFVMVLKSKEDLRDRIAKIARQIEAELEKIVDALERDKLATLGYMLESGLLKIRVAAVADRGVQASRGQLHQKAFVFKDEAGDGVAAAGSTNFTENGFAWHSENLHVFTSWEDPRHFASSEKYFLAAWKGEDPELIVVDLEGDVLRTLSDALKRRSPNAGPVLPTHARQSDQPLQGASELLNMMRLSPEFARFNTTSVPLYPHQERALVDAASRSRIRVMFCDDVGLGKTIEAGATLSYGLKHLGWKKVIVLVPAGLARQWQAELREKIGVLAIRVDNYQRALVSWDESKVGHVDSAWPPGVYIMSAQLASRSKGFKDIFNREVATADCLMLDEAHAARRRLLPSGDPEETLIYKLMNGVAHAVPNLMLLTATPMQSQQEELVALLDLVGLPMAWKDRRFFSDYHDLFRHKEFTTDSAILLERGDKATRRIYPALTPVAPHGLVTDPDAFKRALVASCITPRLIIRNTREALGKIGYKFPKRVVQATTLVMEGGTQEICDELDDYITKYFGQTEAVLFDKKNAIGYLSAIYFQRLVSSFHSAFTTLKKRKDKLESWMAADFENIEVELPDDEEEDGETEIVTKLDDNRRQTAGVKCRQELDVIGPILDRLADYAGVEAGRDPKIKALLPLVAGILSKKEKMLIFSKYTDTTDALIRVLSPSLEAARVGYGYYSGSECWISISGQRTQATKHDIVGGLRSGRIDCVICTDAASEGLNLQSARHLINVDVPWNPARLEQRFGRIDRLGQVADEVYFYNLWYPGSIEDRMYGAIQSRGLAIGFSVGVMSDTVGASIRQHLAGREGTHNLDLEHALSVVQGSQEQLNLQSIEYVCGSLAAADAQGQAFRDALIRLARSIPGASELEGGAVSHAGRIYSTLLGPAQGETITLDSACFNSSALRAGRSSSGLALHMIASNGLPVGAALKVPGGYRVLSAPETAEAAVAAYNGSSLSLPDLAPDIADADTSSAAIDAALSKRFVGRIKPRAVVFDQVLGAPAQPNTGSGYTIYSAPAAS